MTDERLAPEGGRIQIGIVVRDLPAMEEFYSGILGLQFIGEMVVPDGILKRYVLGDAGVKLLSLNNPPPAANPPGGPPGGSGFRYLTVDVPDVAAMVERCVAAGRQVPWLPREARPGLIVAMVEDPEGNWVELAQSS